MSGTLVAGAPIECNHVVLVGTNASHCFVVERRAPGSLEIHMYGIDRVTFERIPVLSVLDTLPVDLDLFQVPDLQKYVRKESINCASYR